MYSNRSLISPSLSRAVLWVLVLAAAAWVLQHIQTTLTVFGMAFFIAYLLNSVVTALEHRYLISRGRSIALVYVLILALAGLAAALLIPLIVEQVNGMVVQVHSLPVKMSMLAETVQENWLSRVPAEYQAQLKEHLASGASTAAGFAGALFEHIRHFVMVLLSGTFLLLTAFIVSIYVLATWPGLGRNLLEILPSDYRDEIVHLGMDLHRIFGGYIRAQIMLATASGVMVLVVLMLHSLVEGSNPYILVIACLTTLAFPIPVVNVVIPCVVAGGLGLVNRDGTYAVVLALLVYLAIQIVERTIAPRIMSEAVGVSPLFVLFAAFAGAELLGPVGALLGVPLAAMAKSVFVWFHGRFLRAVAEETAARPPIPVAMVEVGALLSEMETLKELVRRLEANRPQLPAPEPAVVASPPAPEPEVVASPPAPEPAVVAAFDPSPPAEPPRGSDPPPVARAEPDPSAGESRP